MTGREVVRWTPPARPSGRSVRGFGDRTFIRDGALFPFAAAALFVATGAAVHELVLALVVVVVLVVGSAAVLWAISVRVNRPPAWLPLEVDDPQPQDPAPAQVAAAVRVTVEVVEPAPRRALPAAPQAVEAVYQAVEAEVA